MQAVTPPYDLDAEKNVIASILIDKEALIRAADILSFEDFYEPSHKIIYNAAIELFQSSSPVDAVTVKSFLKKNKELKKGGTEEIFNELTTIIPLTTNIEHYAKIIKEASLRRKIISMSSELVDLGLDQGKKFEDIVDEIEKRIFQITENSTLKSYTHIRDVITELTERLENEDKDKEKLLGLSSGFQGIDGLIGGMHKGDLIILAARPSVGKTAFMLEVIRHQAVNLGKKILVFSLEMGQDQLGDRLLSLQSNVGLMDIRLGQLDGEKWSKCSDAMGELYESDILIDDTPGLHISEVRTKARKWSIEVGVDAIFVDYLQLLQGRNKDNRALEVSQISQGLKNIARELRVPVIALSQLNRAVESRNDRRPQLSDLRESGSIEQDADIVVFLHRDAYYNKEMAEEERNKAEAIVAKNRNGATGIANLRFIDYCAKFVDDN